MRDDAFVGIVVESEPITIPMVSTGTKPWTVHILLNKYPVEFQIDTGADVSVIPEELYYKLEATPLHPTGKSLVGPSHNELQVSGQFTGTLVYKGNAVKEVIYVIKGLRKALIGCPAIMTLQLVSQFLQARCNIKVSYVPWYN